MIVSTAVQIDLQHDFDAPLDALELAVMSPDLGPLLAQAFAALESVEVLHHEVDGTTFRRVWRFRGRTPLAILRSYDITREMMMWEEHSTYRLADHAADWHIVPMGDASPEAGWRKHFSLAGTYRLDPLGNGRCRRSVHGDMAVRVRVLGPVIERVASGEIRKAYDAEATALRSLCTLP